MTPSDHLPRTTPAVAATTTNRIKAIPSTPSRENTTPALRIGKLFPGNRFREIRRALQPRSESPGWGRCRFGGHRRHGPSRSQDVPQSRDRSSRACGLGRWISENLVGNDIHARPSDFFGRAPLRGVVPRADILEFGHDLEDLADEHVG